MPVQPRTPQGVIELLPPQQIAFQRMLDTIRRGFERFGFLPVETPVFELSEVLLTKSGGETEKQVYFAQSTGALKEGKAPELALRFDLTVPLARYVAQHENQLNFPFRRYQIQRVYRGERAQKGRYREFYQCDIDVIGKDTLSISYDAECPAVIYGIFAELNFGKFTIKINNRKLLRGVLTAYGVPLEKHADVLHEIDRLGKMSIDEVKARVKTVIEANTDALVDTLTNFSFDTLPAQFPDNADIAEGEKELRAVYDQALALGVPATHIAVDATIARGLDYYTGTVYETFLDENTALGSICSGGRYDNLAGHYTKSKLPGVGISIGVTRLLSFLVDDPAWGASASTAQVIVLAVDANLRSEYLRIGTELRAAGINTEVYGSDDKLGKQFKYADRAKVPLAIIMGGNEHKTGTVKIKDLRVAMDAAQKELELPRAGLVAKVKELLA
ncbi:MAG TPA: histidine--tRNA ligase [Kofleriaceae bacterium]|jgi:histidyl-tRNA synthetase